MSGPPQEDLEQDPTKLEDILNLLENYAGRFNYYVLDDRPEDHFSIIGPHIFIEYKHTPYQSKKKSAGVWDADSEYYYKFESKFEKKLSHATEMNSEKLTTIMNDINK